MVVFALFGNKINTSNTANINNQSKSKNNEINVLDDLMGLNDNHAYTREPTDNNRNNDLDTSSFNLDDIMNRISVKNNDSQINYRYALITSLYSQVDHLRQELFYKNKVIEHLITNSTRDSIYDNNLEISNDLGSEISTSTNANNYIPQQNDTASINDSLYSDISTDSAITFTDIVKEDYDKQIANYRYKNHWNFIENRRKTDDVIQLTNSQKRIRNAQRIKDALGRIKNKMSPKEPKVAVNNDIIPSSNENTKNYITTIPSADSDALNVYTTNPDNRILWKEGTTLIIGDSMLHSLDETRLKNTKVRVCPGASIEDLHYNIIPLLRKCPSSVIIHVGTNNSTRDTPTQIIEKLLNFKEFISSKNPGIKVIISSLIQRYDDTKAQLTTYGTNTMLKSHNIEIIDNDNITRKHLGKKGHHMTPYGTGRLAINMIKVLKSL